MKVLVTGHRGAVGASVFRAVRERGHLVVGFDLLDGDDLMDHEAVKRAAKGCEAIVHLGALAHDDRGTPEDIMAVNVLGTWHVLRAAECAGANRVIHFSSAQVFGIADGERLPDYFPVDDDHPRRAVRAYGLSKVLAEDLCAGFTDRTGIPTLSLRPVAVWAPGHGGALRARWLRDPRSEWEPFWEYGAFVDVRDVCAAVEDAVGAELFGHSRALLCAREIAASAPTLAMLSRLAPAVQLRDPDRYLTDPSSALLDHSAAERLIGWRPRFGW